MDDGIGFLREAFDPVGRRRLRSGRRDGCRLLPNCLSASIPHLPLSVKCWELMTNSPCRPRGRYLAQSRDIGL
jgi:hypothetical protein